MSEHDHPHRRVVATLDAFHQAEKAEGRMDLNKSAGTDSLAGWFLGPLAENETLLKEMVARAVGAHCSARREYGAQFDDPPYVTPAIKGSDSYKSTVAALDQKLGDMLDALHGSIPLSSYRNQSHMYWDITLPGAIGYFAAMLYNQNNVAAEASPVTTLLEIEVGQDLARMLGYDVPEGDSDALVPWAHITCDGSVANGESMWAARNLKYMGLTLAEAIRTRPDMADARDVTVHGADGRVKRLLDMDTWALMNIAIDDIIGLSPRLQADFGIDPDAIKASLDALSVQSLGLAEMQRRFVGAEAELPIVITPATAHYSWPKSAALIGLGANNLHRIKVDQDGRMRLDHLRETLEACLAAKRPVLEVVAVMGTTEESAVDPLAEIVALRDEFRAKGMEFTLHVDGAWGGYFNSMLRKSPRPFPEEQSGAIEHTPVMMMSDYVLAQYAALGQADTQTVDPHKAGFIPYPAGALCYRNGAMRNMIAFTAPVVFHGGVDPTVGVYGIEGSKPGAAAAGVYLSHSMIRPDQSGYGKLLGKCIFNSKRLFAELVARDGENDFIRIIPFQRLPAERSGAGPVAVAREIKMLQEKINPLENDALSDYLHANPDAAALFKNMGSDQNIITYVVNFRSAEGWNTDITRMNALNNAIYKALSISSFEGAKVPSNPMFVTSSVFDVPTYGQPFVNAYALRTGVAPTDGAPITFLISTTQNPWITATQEGNYLPRVIDDFVRTAQDAARAVMEEHGLTQP